MIEDVMQEDIGVSNDELDEIILEHVGDFQLITRKNRLENTICLTILVLFRDTRIGGYDAPFELLLNIYSECFMLKSCIHFKRNLSNASKNSFVKDKAGLPGLSVLVVA